MPAHEHGDTSPENIEPCSLLLHQPTASPAKRSTWVAHVSVAEARALFIHHHFLRLLLLLLLYCFWVWVGEREREILLEFYQWRGWRKGFVALYKDLQLSSFEKTILPLGFEDFLLPLVRGEVCNFGDFVTLKQNLGFVWSWKEEIERITRVYLFIHFQSLFITKFN